MHVEMTSIRITGQDPELSCPTWPVCYAASAWISEEVASPWCFS